MIHKGVENSNNSKYKLQKEWITLKRGKRLMKVADCDVTILKEPCSCRKFQKYDF